MSAAGDNVDPHACDLAALPAALAERFVKLEPDDEASLEALRAGRHGWWKTRLHSVLRTFLSDFDVNGLIGMYAMHLLDTRQWQQLLGPPGARRLIDIGAGSGDVTASLAPLFGSVTTTETSWAMSRRLARRGYVCFRVDVTEEGVPDKPWDVISCLNVLDRCGRPLTLLEQLRSALAADGRLVLSMPLPYAPLVFDGGVTRDPDEPLPLSDAATWEEGVAALAEHVLAPAGLDIERLARAPYLSAGDSYQPLYVLDDAILVCTIGS